MLPQDDAEKVVRRKLLVKSKGLKRSDLKIRVTFTPASDASIRLRRLFDLLLRELPRGQEASNKDAKEDK